MVDDSCLLLCCLNQRNYINSYMFRRLLIVNMISGQFNQTVYKGKIWWHNIYRILIDLYFEYRNIYIYCDQEKSFITKTFLKASQKQILFISLIQIVIQFINTEINYKHLLLVLIVSIVTNFLVECKPKPYLIITHKRLLVA